MGFFKDFKEDFSEAVNELMPGGAEPEAAPAEETSPAVEEEIDVNAELGKLDGLLEKASKRVEEANEAAEAAPEPSAPAADIDEELAAMEKMAFGDIDTAAPEEPAYEPPKEFRIEPPTPKYEAPKPEPVKEEKSPAGKSIFGTIGKETRKEDKMEETITAAAPKEEEAPRIASDENAVITSGMSIKGDLTSTGSIEIQGRIDGNVDCNGKLTITGTVIGNSRAAEFFADSAHVSGEVVTTGTAKIGLGSVIIGNITATSAVIAGAVKGDIDVQGPVVVDTSAVIMGNIKSRSVQINNGAVIEGFCSQTYAEVDVDKLFG